MLFVIHVGSLLGKKNFLLYNAIKPGLLFLFLHTKLPYDANRTLEIKKIVIILHKDIRQGWLLRVSISNLGLNYSYTRS